MAALGRGMAGRPILFYLSLDRLGVFGRYSRRSAESALVGTDAGGP